MEDAVDCFARGYELGVFPLWNPDRRLTLDLFKYQAGTARCALAFVMKFKGTGIWPVGSELFAKVEKDGRERDKRSTLSGSAAKCALGDDLKIFLGETYPDLKVDDRPEQGMLVLS